MGDFVVGGFEFVAAVAVLSRVFDEDVFEVAVLAGFGVAELLVGGVGLVAGLAVLGLFCDGAVERVFDQVFYGSCGVVSVAVMFGEVERGDLAGVEEEAGAFGVDLVGGDALGDLGDCHRDGGAVVERRQVEDVGAAAAFGWLRDGFAGGVVVVAEVLMAEAGALAAVS